MGYSQGALRQLLNWCMVSLAIGILQIKLSLHLPGQLLILGTLVSDCRMQRKTRSYFQTQVLAIAAWTSAMLVSRTICMGQHANATFGHFVESSIALAKHHTEVFRDFVNFIITSSSSSVRQRPASHDAPPTLGWCCGTRCQDPCTPPTLGWRSGRQCEDPCAPPTFGWRCGRGSQDPCTPCPFQAGPGCSTAPHLAVLRCLPGLGGAAVLAAGPQTPPASCGRGHRHHHRNGAAPGEGPCPCAPCPAEQRATIGDLNNRHGRADDGPQLQEPTAAQSCMG